MTAKLPRSLDKGQVFRQKLLSAAKVSGVWSTLGSADVAYLMARAGLDYIVLDLEHGAGGFETVVRQVQALSSLDTCVMVRSPDHSAASMKRILDAGANAILVPCVNTVEQAREIVDAVRFSPQGSRGVAVGAIAAADYGYMPIEYFENANAATTIILQIETAQAVANIEQLVQVDGVDGFFVGPNDLSAQLGIFRQYQQQAFIDAIEKVARTVKRSGKILGSLPYPGCTSTQLQDSGYQLAPGGSDQLFLREGALSAKGEQS